MSKIDPAPPSPQLQRAYEKCEAQLKDNKKQFTEEALKAAKDRMYQQFQRHSGEQIPIKNTFAVFDGNKHPAPAVDQTVQELRTTLENAPTAAPTSETSLEDRVTYRKPLEGEGA